MNISVEYTEKDGVTVVTVLCDRKPVTRVKYYKDNDAVLTDVFSPNDTKKPMEGYVYLRKVGLSKNIKYPTK